MGMLLRLQESNFRLDLKFHGCKMYKHNCFSNRSGHISKNYEDEMLQGKIEEKLDFSISCCFGSSYYKAYQTAKLKNNSARHCTIPVSYVSGIPSLTRYFNRHLKLFRSALDGRSYPNSHVRIFLDIFNTAMLRLLPTENSDCGETKNSLLLVF